MKLRIDKMLSNIGLGTRKQIKQDAKKGLIKINDVIEKDSSKIIDTEKDTVKYKGETAEYVQYIYLMMNKPQGVVSATEDNYDRTVIDLLDDEDKFYEPFPVGRLDKDTEGLLLITNDGQLAHNLLSPKKHVDKTYYVEVAEEVTQDDVKSFREGVILTEENYKTLPAELHIIQSGYPSKCYVTIKEGKFHQVKRMFFAINNEVTYLKRVSMGLLKLDESLKLGEYRHLTQDELNILGGHSSTYRE
ncbi:MAG: pseudouridine synthase [Sedimentibacter sp.]|uniref:16S rRNA pseudouridine(516) synthase n=1 Tax=Sedimentibacter sp. TaxID=1960295 RepID=UPI00298175BD|nr:pseudouridine synthase [Sedimentibacter sp.]MDW5300313.1 pseudouridine synthase [Sedimentibacter sp.]